MIGACLQAQEWIEKSYGPYSITANLSGVQLENGEIIHQVQQVLEETQIGPSLYRAGNYRIDNYEPP